MSSVTANIQRFWSSAVEPPDLASWWSSCVVSGDPAESRELLAALRLDQQFRWRTSQPWLVEDYLASLPQLPLGVNWRMELAVGEWHARPADQPLSPQDLQTRFPELPDLPAHLVTFPENADTLLLIDRVCDRLEELHRSRAVRPRLEFCLANLPLHCRQDGFCSLLTAELECLQGQAETLQSQSWLDRFPAYREQIVRVFAELSPRDESPPKGTSPSQPQDQTIVSPEGLRNVRRIDDGGKSERSQAEDIFRRYLKPANRRGSIGRLGHYEVDSILGSGAFGIVARAFDEKLHRVVAIKLMSPGLAATSPPRKRFLREARAVAAVNHENIVAIHAVEEEPMPFIVMEYVPGMTLQQWLDRNGPMDVAHVLGLGQQIAGGLAAAHAVQLIHRDIKPSNILVSDKLIERIKISDFGLARTADDASLTQSGLISGTPMYMAPEQARGETLDQRADLFSLGCVLYQAICGRPPFRAPSTVAVLKRVCEDTPRSLNDILPGIPPWLEKIVFRLLSKKKEDRYQTAKEVADLLGRCRWELEHNRVVTCVDVDLQTVPAQQLQVSQRGRLRVAGVTIGLLLPLIALIAFALVNTTKKKGGPELLSHSAARGVFPHKNSSSSLGSIPEQQSPLLYVTTAKELLAFDVSSGEAATIAASRKVVLSSGDTLIAPPANPIVKVVDNLLGLASDASGNLFVADNSSNCIVRIDRGWKSTVYSEHANGPRGVAIDKFDNVYSSVAGLESVVRVEDGKAIGAGGGVPAGLEVDSSGNIFVAMNIDGSVLKFDSEGRVTVLAKSLSNPIDVALHPDGAIYVSCNHPGDNSIFRIGSDSRISRVVGGAAGPLNRPYGLAFDGRENLFVANEGSDRISLLTPDGAVQFSFPTGSPSPRFLAFAPAPAPEGQLLPPAP